MKLFAAAILVGMLAGVLGQGYPSPAANQGGGYSDPSANNAGASQERPRGDLGEAMGLVCPRAGYMFPDANNLCFVWYCVYPGQPPIKRACPKGVRVPSWWDGGELNMCFVVNIEKHHGDPVCLRCDANDVLPATVGCASNPCDEGCVCEDTEYTHRCDCPETGIVVPVEYVPPPRDHCSPNPCVNGASCQNQWDGFFCFCPSGFTGHRCELSVCDWHPCLNGGTCVVDEVGYHCECTTCWTGSCCNVTMPACDLPGGSCPTCKTGQFCESVVNSCDCLPPDSELCSAGSECVNTDRGPECQACDEPQCYIQGCKIRKDTCECTKYPCPANSRCENLIDTDSHECICNECWEGPKCNIATNNCACSNPCPDHATCRDTAKGPMCACDACTKGDYCEKPVVSCECNSPCSGNEACRMDAYGQPECYCADPCYFGTGCLQKRSSCECSNPCNAGQQCSEVNGALTCGCADSCKTGPYCSETLQTCDCLRPCGSNENCIEGATGVAPTCECKDRCKYGPGCTETYNTCDCRPCPSGETCTMVNGAPSCGCSDSCLTGAGCRQRVNTCECSNPCNRQQQCYLNAQSELACRCADSCYYGEYCDQKVNTCECQPCGDRQTCISNADGSKSGCVCTDSCYTGPECNVKVDTCECNNPCAAGETCTEESSGQLTCGCADSCRTGPGCADYVNTCQCSNPCNAGQQCGTDGSGELYCYCSDPCKTGPNCADTVQSCQCASTCQGAELCQEGVAGAPPSCYCADSCKYGPGCSQTYNTCECTTCPAGEVCSMVGGQPACACADSCKTGPGCVNTVQSCECAQCPYGEACRLTQGLPECYCEDPCTTGPGCANRINSCACSNPCNPGQECYMNDQYELSCRCADSCFGGDNCDQRIPSCLCSDPCVGYGTCVEAVNGLMCDDCTDSCHTGPLCRDTKQTCECSNPCPSYKVCTNTPDGPQCACPTCYEGPDCSQRVQSCECSNPCASNGNGRCHESLSGPTCVCEPCWTGAACDIRMNTCECSTDCAGYQECRNVGNDHVCECPDCYSGPRCADRIDSCRCNNPCKPADLCKETSAGIVTCKCDCVGNEQCYTDPLTEREECRCPSCFYNKEGERGCPSRITNTCDCNSCSGDQEVCVDNDDALGNVECKIDNPSSGHSFTVVFEENNTERSIREIPLEIYFSSAVWNNGARTVRVRTPGLHPMHYCHVDETVEVPAGTVYRFPLERCLMQNGTGLDRLAIRITEVNNRSISVYGINKDRWTADGFLALPDEKAGKEFQTTSYAPAHIATQFCVVVLYDHTEITMRMADDNNLAAPYNVKDSVFRTKLNAFETYQVQARCQAPPSKKTQCELDLTGTEIIASKPIHVFSGNVRAWVPDLTGKSRDHLIEEILPRDRWGTDFAVVAVPHRVVGDLLQIMAVNGQRTNCHFYSQSGVAPSSLSLPYKGRYNRVIDIPSNGMYRLKCTKPVFVVQLTKSQDQGYLYNNETFHDPVSMTVPPITQFTNNFFLNTPQYTGGENFRPQPYDTTYALLVAKAREGNGIMLNQERIRDFVTPWRNLPRSLDPSDPDLIGAVIRIPHGTNIIRNRDGKNFQCLVYGYDDRESYGFPAAMALGKYRA